MESLVFSAYQAQHDLFVTHPVILPSSIIHLCLSSDYTSGDGRVNSPSIDYCGGCTNVRSTEYATTSADGVFISLSVALIVILINCTYPKSKVADRVKCLSP